MDASATKRKQPDEATDTSDPKPASNLSEEQRKQKLLRGESHLTGASPARKVFMLQHADSPAGSPMKGIEESPSQEAPNLDSHSKRVLFPSSSFGKPPPNPLAKFVSNETSSNGKDLENSEVISNSIKKNTAQSSGNAVFGSSFASTTSTSFASFAKSGSSVLETAADKSPLAKSETVGEKNPFGSTAFGDSGRTKIATGTSFLSHAAALGAKSSFADMAKLESTKLTQTTVVETLKSDPECKNDNLVDTKKKEQKGDGRTDVFQNISGKVTFGGSLGGRDSEQVGVSDSLKQNVSVKAVSFDASQPTFGSKASSSMGLSFGSTTASKESATFEALLQESKSESKSASRKEAGKADDSGDEDEVVLNEEVSIEKRVDLPAIEVRTGEEDESNLYQVRCKLYRMDDNNNWKERGVGNLRLNFDEVSGNARLVMRSAAVLKLILNVRILPGMPVQIVQEKYVQFACCEDSGDKLSRFLVKTGDAASAFKLYDYLKELSSKSS